MVAQSETYVNSETQGSYDTVKISAWKTWSGSTHDGTKGGGNKGRSYTCTYETGAYLNTTV